MEADDLGTYVMKFRGAGQGRQALIAEVVSTGLRHGHGRGGPGPGRPGDVVRRAGDHALAGCGARIDEADRELSVAVDKDVLREATAEIPEEWLVDEPGFDRPDQVRAAYVSQLVRPAGRAAGVAAWTAGRGGWWYSPRRADQGPAGQASLAYRPSGPFRCRAAAMTGGRHAFEYAVLRVVPRVDRGETMNAGILL